MAGAGADTGDAAFKAAEDDYQQGSYAQAIAKYDDYLERHPDHASASAARVHRGLSQMRQKVDGATDWVKALDGAQEILKQIRVEDEFKDARPELAAMLPKVAKGLASQAAQQQDPTVLARAHEAVDLVYNNQYVPKKLRNEPELLEIKAKLSLVQHGLNRDQRLADDVQRIEKAVTGGDTNAAYAIRKQLLQEYPDLVNNDRLQQSMHAATQAERDLVKFVRQPVPAETSEPQSPIQTTNTLTHTTGGVASAAQGHVLTVLAAGAAYGLDAASGKVLWRRFVQSQPRILPETVSLQPAADVLLVDTARKELVRVTAQQGKLQWRAPLSEQAAAEPVVARDWAYLATRDGRLSFFRVQSGESPGYVQLPQTPDSPPTVDRSGKFIYQAGSHSNFYIIDASNGACQSVVYLGHEAGTVRTAPVIVSSYILVAEDLGAQNTRLRVLLLEKDGASAKQVQEIRLDGQVRESPIAQGRALIVSTDRGGVYVYNVSPPGKEKPLTEVATRSATHEQPVAPFTLLGGSAQLWVADIQLTHYDIQAASGRLASKWVKEIGDTFLQPLKAAGDVVFHVRTKRGTPGVLVAASQMKDGTHVWETRLAAPPATGAMVDPANGNVSAVTAAGELFQLTPDRFNASAVRNTPASQVPVRTAVGPESQVRHMADGRVMLGVDGARALILDRSTAGASLRWLTLPTAIAGDCTPFQGALLAPGGVGQVFCIDAASGKAVAEPFQPRLVNGAHYTWIGSLENNQQDVLLFDGVKMLYRIGRSSTPVEHLEALRQAELAAPLVSAIARLDDLAFAVDAAGKLHAWQVASLELAESWDLPGEAVWGPQRIEDRVLVATDDDHLLCFASQAEKPALLWTAEIASGPLAGAPLRLENGDYLLASVHGELWRISAATGQEAGKVHLGQPLTGGPAVLNGHCLLTGHDSALHVTAIP